MATGSSMQAKSLPREYSECFGHHFQWGRSVEFTTDNQFLSQSYPRHLGGSFSTGVKPTRFFMLLHCSFAKGFFVVCFPQA